MSRPPLPSLEQVPIIGILRRLDLKHVVDVADEAARAGLITLEVTLDSDEAFRQIRTLVEALPEANIGAGTVLSAEDAERAIRAGAGFLVSPVTDMAVLDVALVAKVPYIPGASTPTEIWAAHQAGATAVKVFPAKSLGGPLYLSAIASLLDGVPLIPTGGVGLNDLKAYLDVGAAAVGMGGSLFPIDEDAELIRGRIRQVVEALK